MGSIGKKPTLLDYLKISIFVLTDKVLDGLRARVEYIRGVNPNLAVFNEGHVGQLVPLAPTSGAMDVDGDRVLVGANDALNLVLLVSVSKIREGECPVLEQKKMYLVYKVGEASSENLYQISTSTNK